jgi:hypothetical protein
MTYIQYIPKPAETKNIGGDWPPTKETLVNKYLQIFVKFIKSIDFADLQLRYTCTIKDGEADR